MCRIGDVASRRLIVLVGDSHAMMWLPALLELARHDHWAVTPLLRLGCTPGKWTTSLGREPCHDWYRWALRQAARLRPDVTLLGGSIDDRPTATTRAAVAGIVAAAHGLAARGRVAVIGDPEALDRDPVDCLLRRGASMATCTTRWGPEALAGYDDVARHVSALGVGFIRTRGFVCFERSCPTVIGHTIAWADSNHLSAAYSGQVAGAFRTAFLQALERP